MHEIKQCVKIEQFSVKGYCRCLDFHWKLHIQGLEKKKGTGYSLLQSRAFAYNYNIRDPSRLYSWTGFIQTLLPCSLLGMLSEQLFDI